MSTPPLTRTLTRSLLVTLALAVPFALAACGGEDAEGVTQVTPPTEETSEGLAADAPAEPRMEDGVQVVEITVVADGYQPQEIHLQEDVPARLVFTRTTDQTCATQIKVPAFAVGPVDLPLNEPVAVEFTPSAAGDFTFTCGMDMVSGSLVVQS